MIQLINQPKVALDPSQLFSRTIQSRASQTITDTINADHYYSIASTLLLFFSNSYLSVQSVVSKSSQIPFLQFSDLSFSFPKFVPDRVHNNIFQIPLSYSSFPNLILSQSRMSLLFLFYPVPNSPEFFPKKLHIKINFWEQIQFTPNASTHTTPNFDACFGCFIFRDMWIVVVRNILLFRLLLNSGIYTCESFYMVKIIFKIFHYYFLDE